MDSKNSQSQEWYQRWFNQVYASLYSHRNQEQAEKQVEGLLSTIEKISGPLSMKRVLDIACGGGRHVSALHNQLRKAKNISEKKTEVQIVGMDLSWDLLQTVEPSILTQNDFLRGDMKHLPFPTQSFDLVTSFFSSYGYFKNPEEDKQALAKMLETLKKSGFFFLDLVNKEVVLQNLVSQDSKYIGDWHVEQKRYVEGNVIVKDIYLHSLSSFSKNSQEGNGPRHYQERLRVYSQEEMEELFANWGLKVCCILGSEKGEVYSKKTSPRMSFLVHKK